MTWKQLAFSDDVLTNPMTADLDMDDYDITGLAELSAGPIGGIDVKDSLAASKITLASTTYAFAASANANMDGNKLVGLGAGTLDGDAIRKDQALLLDGTQAMTAALNMSQNEIDAMVFENLATAPHSGTEVQGEVYYDTTDDHIHVWVV